MGDGDDEVAAGAFSGSMVVLDDRFFITTGPVADGQPKLGSARRLTAPPPCSACSACSAWHHAVQSTCLQRASDASSPAHPPHSHLLHRGAPPHSPSACTVPPRTRHTRHTLIGVLCHLPQPKAQVARWVRQRRGPRRLILWGWHPSLMDLVCPSQVWYRRWQTRRSVLRDRSSTPRSPLAPLA